MRDDYEYRLTNREASKEPRARHYWCGACDGNMVSNGGRCTRCWVKDPGKRFKSGKPTPR